jgi:hypothetical protein
MSEQSEVIESAASSSVGSIVAKTAAGGSSLGAPAALPLPVMQTPILFGLSPGEICQIIGTAYIVGLVVVAIIKKYKAIKKLNKELYESTIMGGSGGHGP